MSGPIEHTVGSSNVFADLGLPDADKRLAKAKLAYRISKLVEERAWTATETSEALGIDHREVSALLDGRLAAFPLERLFHFLTALDQDVEISVRPNPSSERPASVTVAAD